MNQPVSRTGHIAALLGAVLLAAFTWLTLDPGVGYDDANIILNYAENIANGDGYVYYVGGERVEGSTSLLWTGVAVVSYLLPGPARLWLAFLGFLSFWGVLLIAMKAAGSLAQATARGSKARAEVVTVALFAILPATAAWHIWSLMDLGLWILLVTLGFWLSVSLVRGDATRRDRIALGTAALLLPMARPEGIAVALGLAILVLGFSRLKSHAASARQAAGIAALACLSFAVVTLGRFLYFGAPFPNTFYAKTSTALREQAQDGWTYVVDFITQPEATLVLIVFLIFPFLRAAAPVRAAWTMAALTVGGALAIYALLGGDHFRQFRFFQVLFPIMLPFAAVVLLPGLSRWQTSGRRLAGVWAPVALGFFICLSWLAFFLDTSRGMTLEIRLAERGIEVGERLNGYPGTPSVGTVPAGGISMSYNGVIYDLLGLNWKEMALAGRDEASVYKNHGGFNEAVFFATLPEIVHPEVRECDPSGYVDNGFINQVLKGLFSNEQFLELYELECWQGLIFFRLKDGQS